MKKSLMIRKPKKFKRLRRGMMTKIRKRHKKKLMKKPMKNQKRNLMKKPMKNQKRNLMILIKIWERNLMIRKIRKNCWII